MYFNILGMVGLGDAIFEYKKYRLSPLVHFIFNQNWRYNILTLGIKSLDYNIDESYYFFSSTWDLKINNTYAKL